MRRGDLPESRRKWQLPSLISMLPSHSKVSTERSKTFDEAIDGLPRHVFITTTFNTQNSQCRRNLIDSSGFPSHPLTWQSFESAKDGQTFLHNQLQKINQFPRSPGAMATVLRRQSSPLLIQTSNQYSRMNFSSPNCASDEQAIRASQYLYNMATWRMYKRIEAARTQKRLTQGGNGTHIPHAFVPSCDIHKENSVDETKYMYGEYSNMDSNSGVERETEDMEGDSYSVQFDIEL